MGDFFYYGQKDTIRRLNELAGRGAVVASYAPAVGRSPLGGSNGYMNPAWIDPNLPLKSNVPISAGSTAKYGYTYVTNGVGFPRWILVATLIEEGAGTNGNLLIKGIFNNGWQASGSSPFTVFMGVRGGFYVDWHIEGPVLAQSRIVVVRRADGKHDVYAYFAIGAFSTLSFDLTGVNVTTYELPVETTTTPDGTIVFDTSAIQGDATYIAPRWSASPYNSRGTVFREMLAIGDGSISTSFITAGAKIDEFGSGPGKEVLGLGVGAISGAAFRGRFGFLAGAGNGSLYKEGYRLSLKAYDEGSNVWSVDLLNIKGDGQVYVPRLRAGTSSSDVNAPYHLIARSGVQGDDILSVDSSVGFRRCEGDYGNTTNAAMIVMANTVTGRSSNNKGTVNTMGNDYAEYIFKSSICSIVAPGQIVGITADNKVTDKWADAVMFSIKSTAPSFVGGDSWASGVGQRPSPQAGPEPIQPLRREDVVAQQPVPGTNPPEYADVVTEPGDTDSEWAEKQAAYIAALAAHNIAVQQDAEAMAAFDAALEVERQKVDRIAIAGRVPVNVQGAQPGDYIVPAQDGAGIKGIAVHEDDLSMKQYLRAVGRVISIEPDGRAYVMVKVV